MAEYHEFIVDPRSRGDLVAEMGRLAASYTPEWKFDPEDPDIGAVIGLIFADQMSDTVGALNQVMDKYRTEFVNMLGISLLPATPAGGVAVVNLVPDTVPGVQLPKGSRLQGQAGEDGEAILFETAGDVYVTSARLTDILSISGHFGKIIPIRGGPTAVSILPRRAEAVEEVPAEQEETGIPLFDFSRDGVQRSAVLLYHRTILRPGKGVELFLHPEGQGGSIPAALLANPRMFSWTLYSGDGPLPFDRVEARGGELVLCLDRDAPPLAIGEDSYYLVCAEAVGESVTPVVLSGLTLSASCDHAVPDFLGSGDQELSAERCFPFGETASLFSEFYIGMDGHFSQAGAQETIRFQLSFQEKLVSLPAQQEVEDLRIIKRKPRTIQYETARCCVQAVSVDYFNGIGWKSLPCRKEIVSLFNGEYTGEAEISFEIPEDWQPTAVGSYQGRCIRLRVTQADNCYLQPCLHNMPVIEGVSLSYRYRKGFAYPQLLQSICGTRIMNLTPDLMAGRSLTLFPALPYPGNALYLGLDRRPEGAPVSLLFDVSESVHFRSAPVSFEYSALSGWKPLKVIDNTENMSAAGTVLFMPPSDMAPVAVEGITRYWVRLVDANSVHDDPNLHHPLIRDIYLNAVEIRNIETLPEESFYLQTPVPDMSFQLAAQSVLDAEVFVNEADRLSQPMMQQLLRERPGDVRAEYDHLGRITRFFVRWSEVDSFDRSKPGDRHYRIDRLRSRIEFGDGVHVRIPTCRTDVAFTVRARRCNGSSGNLPRGAVNALRGRSLYVSSVYNPIETYAGSDMETPENAQKRGCNLFCSRGRLVSQTDFVREVESFSSAIQQVRCMAGVDIDGNENPPLVTIAVMMRDYADGAYSFHSIRGPLRRRLLSQCEATLSPDCLVLSEPVYVSISLSVWAEADDPQLAFSLQNLIQEELDRFLSPIGRDGRGGWRIGTLPTYTQLDMLLRTLRGAGRVSRFLATARFVDRTGAHECALEEMRPHPFAVPVPGKHRIYIELPGTQG